MTKEKIVKPYATVKNQGEYLIWSSNEEFIRLGLKYMITKKIGIIRLPILNKKFEEIEITIGKFKGEKRNKNFNSLSLMSNGRKIVKKKF
jgi:hypothetical protein